MLLNIPVQDLLASRLDIQLGHLDGRLSCKLKPNSQNTCTGLASEGWAGITLNLESVGTDNGYILSLYASPDESATPQPPSVPLTPSDLPLFDPPVHDFSHSTPMPAINLDANPMSFLLSDASPPPEYFSEPSYEPSPASTVSSEHSCSALLVKLQIHGGLQRHFDFDFASSEFNEFSQLMGIAPNDSLDHTNPPSYCARPGPSRLPSPNPFHAAAPSPASDTEDTASLLALTSTAASASTSTSRSSSPFLSAHSTFIASTPHPSFETDTAVEDENGRIGRHAKRPCLHPTCERVLTSPDMRQVHMGIHKTKVRKAFLCTLGCGEVFTRRHDRQRHEVALHGKKCQYVCARCKRFFSNARMLDRHVCRGQRQGSIQWPLGDDEVPDASSAPEGNSP